MPAPQLIAGLAELAPRYDVVLCDVWGVIHDGVKSFRPAVEALRRFKAERGPVILISNAPRPAADVLAQLEALAVGPDAYTTLVTSGDATRAELARRPGPVWAIGPERDAALYAGLDLTFAGPEDAAFISCTGLVDDDTETAADYADALTVAAGRGLVMVCANPDRVVQRGDRLIPCAGALADLYETLGGEVVMAGKPYAPIYDQSLQAAAEALGRPVDRARVLCIGDGIKTDVLGAARQNLDCLFVAGGIHAAELAGPDGPLDPKKAAALLADSQTHARWLAPSLFW